MVNLLFKQLKNFDFKKQIPEIFDKIEKIKIKSRKEIEHEGAFLGIVDSFKNEKFLYIRAYKEYERKAGFYDGNAEQLKQVTSLNGEFHAIIISSDGSIIHEISSFFHDNDIKKLLLDLFKSCGFHKISIKDVEEFDLKTMRTFYKTAKRIVELTLNEIGQIEPNPTMPPEQIEKITQDMAEGSNYMEFKSGVNRDLKKSQLINEGLSRRSRIRQVRGYDEEGDIFDINVNGRIKTHLPTDEAKQANKLYKIIEKILGIFQ